MKNIVTVGVSSLDDAKDRLASAFRGEPQGSRISFLSVEQMWKTLSPKRTEILRAMTGRPHEHPRSRAAAWAAM